MLKQTEKFVYLNPPLNFAPEMEVVACFLRYEDKILFLKRHVSKSEGNTWCVPGGKREKGEGLAQAMSRELYEETQLKLTKENFLFAKTTFARYPKFDFNYHLFRYDFSALPPRVIINKDEHEVAQWVNLSIAFQLALTPGIEEALNILFSS